MRKFLITFLAVLLVLLSWSPNSTSAATAFPTKAVVDSFNRSNGSIGEQWSIDQTGFSISNNQLEVVSEGMILWNSASYGADQEAYVTFANINASSSNMDLLLKSQSSSEKTSMLEVTYKPSKKIIQVLSYTTANGYVQYGANIPATFVNGDQLGVMAAADGQVYVYKNGVQLASRNAAAWKDSGKGGYIGLLAWGGAGSIFDNFGGGTTVASAPSTPAATGTVANTPRPTATRTATAIITNPTVTRTATVVNTVIPTATKTKTPAPAATATTKLAATNTVRPTSTRTSAPTATRTLAPILTSTPASGTRPLKYYLADRVVNNADFAQLAAWGINTAMVDFDVNGSATTWRSVFTAAAKYNINIVIWPSDWNNPRPDCDWESPFPISAGGDITKVKPLLDVASQYSNFIGIINGHESFWTCTNMTFDEMAGLKTQLKAYALSKGRAIKVWNYINALYDTSMFPNNQIERVMDVAIIWKHCAGNAEGSCNTPSNGYWGDAMSMIKGDRARLTSLGLNGKVELVFVMQTFTASGYSTKFTLSQLQTYSCAFLNTQALDGFGYYTWDAGWWADLQGWSDLQPGVSYINNTCTP